MNQDKQLCSVTKTREQDVRVQSNVPAQAAQVENKKTFCPTAVIHGLTLLLTLLCDVMQ